MAADPFTTSVFLEKTWQAKLGKDRTKPSFEFMINSVGWLKVMQRRHIDLKRYTQVRVEIFFYTHTCTSRASKATRRSPSWFATLCKSLRIPSTSPSPTLLISCNSRSRSAFLRTVPPKPGPTWIDCIDECRYEKSNNEVN
jgi:hypothetical protein